MYHRQLFIQDVMDLKGNIIPHEVAIEMTINEAPWDLYSQGRKRRPICCIPLTYSPIAPKGI